MLYSGIRSYWYGNETNDLDQFKNKFKQATQDEIKMYWSILKAESSKNFLMKLLKKVIDQKIPEVDYYRAIQQLVILERKMGTAANEYLEFGSTGAIEYFETKDGHHYFGEVYLKGTKNQKARDEKGIMFEKNGCILI